MKLLILKCITLLLLLSLKLNSQSLIFDKTSYSIEEGKDTDSILKINIQSKTKKKNICIRVMDMHEGTADSNDYVFNEPGNFELNSGNAYSTVLSITIKKDDKEEKDEYIKLHFLFASAEDSSQVDSTLLITIQDQDTKQKKIDLYSKLNWASDTTNNIKTEFVQFTDFLGFANDRPNGLLQQQFLFKWPIVKRYLVLDKNIRIQPLRSILFPNLLFNRIDKSGDNGLLFPVSTTIREIDSSNSVQKDTSLSPVISSFDIHRYTAQKIEARLILFALFIGKTRIHLEYIPAIIRNRIADTITSKGKTERSVYSFSSGWAIYLKSDLDKKTQLNIESEIGYIKFYLKDNFFKQYDVFKLDNTEKRAIALPVGEKYNRTQAPIYYFRISLNKEWGKESKNSAFFRFRYNYQTGKFKYYDIKKPAYIREEHYFNHYLQLQLGISLGFETLFSK